MKINRIPEFVRDLFHYNPETGSVTWKNKGKRLNGKEAGNLDKNGYIRIECRGARLCAHRIAWYLYRGEDPPEQIDHINGCRSDNRICNLRLANYNQNLSNSKLSKRNSSGIKGVTFNKACNKWQAQISANNESYYLGCFSDLKEAAIVVSNARKILHGEFANFASRIEIDDAEINDLIGKAKP
jgi:hypothetical protein